MNEPNNLLHWKRVIALVDMNAFFCSVEQMDHPEWEGRPIGITNGSRGSTLITCSYEARAYGIKTGMRLPQALKQCPDFIRVPARPERYAQISSDIMNALGDITPDIEVFSVDEAFLDLTHCRVIYQDAEVLGRLIKKTVHEVSGGVLSSVGVSTDKTWAKYAAKLNKPDGLTIIAPQDLLAVSESVPVTDLCGINKGIGKFLNDRGVYTCGDMAQLPIGELARRFGNLGRRIWLMSQGHDPDPVTTNVAPPKTIGHGKVMPPDTRDKQVLLTFALHMSEKVAARLRRNGFKAQKIFVGFRGKEQWFAHKYPMLPPTRDGRDIYAICVRHIETCWQGLGVFQIQVTAMGLCPENGQLDLFHDVPVREDKLNKVLDAVNERYGEFTLARSKLLKRSDMPNVIAPAWKPTGHRQTIPSTGKQDKN